MFCWSARPMIRWSHDDVATMRHGHILRWQDSYKAIILDIEMATHLDGKVATWHNGETVRCLLGDVPKW